ncbi:MAG: hypothetical protein FWH10_06555 [Oscillospiraceae bacterium]|nr:hypothetical protein [Oscillospiraceae bacterium]
MRELDNKNNNNETEQQDKSGRLRGYVCIFSAAGIAVLGLTMIILGYVVSFRGSDGEMRNGLGRILDEVPAALSWIFIQWAGHIWLIIDLIILLGMIMLIDRLLAKSRIYFKGVKNVDF